jgi:hypothetical protein
VSPKNPLNDRLSRRPLRLVAAAALAALALSSSAAAASHKAQVHARCAGDVVSGTVRSTGPGDVKVDLMAKRTSNARFAPAGQSSWVHAAVGATGYQFSFNVARLSAVAYRVDVAGSHSNEVPLASCAPGHQVPEAPAALLLPMSALALLGLRFGRRRRLRNQH